MGFTTDNDTGTQGQNISGHGKWVGLCQKRLSRRGK